MLLSTTFCYLFFFFNDTATTEIYTLSLHDALPICDEDDLLTIPFVFVAADFTFVLDDLVFHARKEVGPVVVIVLRPAVERMIVALGALQARAEEHLRRRFGARGGIAVGTVEIRRGTAVGAAAGSDEFAHEFVQRLFFDDALANPMMEVLHAFLVERMGFDAQEV